MAQPINFFSRHKLFLEVRDIKDSSKKLSRAVKKGAGWTFLGRVLIFIINMGGTIVLARLLEPEDFGVFGIGLLFVGLATRFGNIGFGLALVQREEIEDIHVSSLFVVNFLLFSSMGILLMWASPAIGNYFNSSLSGEVLFVLAFLFFLNPFSSVARALLQRRMEFKATAVAGTLQHFVGVLAAIGFAWNGFGVWSLVYSEIIRSFLSLIVVMFYARWWPHFSYKHTAMKDLASFGFAIFFKRLLTYGSEKVEFIIVGKELGVGPLGFYERAYGLMHMTIKELGNRLEPVLFRAFSIIQNDRGRILAAYKKVLLTFSLISYPIFFGLASVAPSFIYLFYGERWMPSVIPLQIMCFSGLFHLQLKVITIVMNAMGEVKVETGLRAIALILLLIGCGIGSKWGIVGVATAVTMVSGILCLAVTIYFSHLTQLNFFVLVRPQAAPFAASVLMSVMVLLVKNLLLEGDVYSFSVLFSSVTVGVFAYVGALFILSPPPVIALIKEIVGDLKPAFKKFKRSS